MMTQQLEEFDAAVKQVTILHLIESLKKLSPEDRDKVFSNFCPFCPDCGNDSDITGYKCHCENDE